MINDFESNLPIPNSERNYGSSLEVCQCQHQMGGHQHPWRKAQSEYDADQATYPGNLPEVVRPKRKILGLKTPIALLTLFLALCIASIVLLGGLLGHKISQLEKQVDNNSTTSPVQTPPAQTPGLSLGPAPQTEILQITVPGWSLLGCFYDNWENRALREGYFYDKDNMTNNVCAEKCAQAKFFGTEWRRCFCGDSGSNSRLKRAPDWACQTQCPGQQTVSEACGGDKARISVWQRNT
ncbi:xylosyltransferase oxt [Podospora fimiseda]|uniref:Xylosyltransferase oxt n=1 Tax=Podospora fimiseda TaxID=252190 RepID=A0AAN7BWN4_9PEZI|nr:xylosyltransferase oxt [Podospora fimiseda]